MEIRPTQDARNFYVLPQGYEGGGYYTYGSPGNGISQYAHPNWKGLNMRRQYAFAACAALLWSATVSGTERHLEPHKKISGVYRIYGGELGDPVAPTSKDSKLMVSVDGTMAKELFDAIGPDVKDICTEGSGTRVREKDGGRLSCTRSGEGEYSCNFGFDLRSGKSVGGSIC